MFNSRSGGIDEASQTELTNEMAENNLKTINEEYYSSNTDRIGREQSTETNEPEIFFWGNTRRMNTVSAYENYLIAYPEGKYVDSAKSKIANASSNRIEYFTDSRDGERYKWVRIGDQIWMSENLRFAQGRYIISNKEWVDLGDNNYDAAYCWYNNDISKKQKYGALYTYAAAIKACPEGWHLPSDEEWSKLENFIIKDGYSSNVGKALKSTMGWKNNGNGTENYNFTAFPSGYRYNNSRIFYDVGGSGRWWSGTDNGSGYAYYRYLYYNYANIGRNNNRKSHGYSVRCVRDN